MEKPRLPTREKFEAEIESEKVTFRDRKNMQARLEEMLSPRNGRDYFTLVLTAHANEETTVPKVAGIIMSAIHDFTAAKPENNRQAWRDLVPRFIATMIEDRQKQQRAIQFFKRSLNG